MKDDNLGVILTSEDFEMIGKLMDILREEPNVTKVALNREDSKWEVVLYGDVSSEQIKQYKLKLGDMSSKVELYTEKSIEEKEYAKRLLRTLNLGAVYGVNEKLEERHY